MPSTIEDRAIVINMRRKLPTETRDKFSEAPQSMFDVMMKKCLRFIEDNIEKFQNTKLMTLPSLNDRASDNWKPLLLIAQ